MPNIPWKFTPLGHGAPTDVPYNPHALDHEKLNHVVFTPTQAARIEQERPIDGIPEATCSGYELAAYRMPNGSRFVTLMDATERTWELYCAERVGVHSHADCMESAFGEHGQG